MVRIRGEAAIGNPARAMTHLARQHFAAHRTCIAADYLVRRLMLGNPDRATLELGRKLGFCVGQPSLTHACQDGLQKLKVPMDDFLNIQEIQEEQLFAPATLADDALNDSLFTEGYPSDLSGKYDISPVLWPSEESRSSVKIHQTETRGRGLIATKRIAPEAEIFAERPFVSAPGWWGFRAGFPKQSQESKWCHHCLSQLPANTASIQQCPRNNCESVYCGMVCREQALIAYHGCLCCNEGFASWQQQLRTAVPPKDSGGLSSTVAANFLVARICANGALFETHPRSLPAVAAVAGQVSFNPRQTLDATGALTLSLGDALRQPFFFLEDFLLLFAKVQQNMFLDPTGRGARLHVGFSLLNHSCSPNTMISVHPQIPNIYRLVSLAKIEPGEELFIDYTGGKAAKLPLSERRSLCNQRGFICKCSKCQSEEG